MSTRITAAMVSGSTLRDITSAYANLQQTGRELATGKSILEPSNNPYGAGRAITLQSTIEGLSAYNGNVHEAVAWENTATSALSSIGTITNRVRELTIQSVSGVNNKGDLENMAGEVEQLTEAVKQDANVQYAGRYVLSGTATETAPYQLGAEDTYHGNEGAITRTIGPGTSVQINQSAASLLGNGPASADGKLLDTLRTIAKHMREDTPESMEALRGSDLEHIEANMTMLLQMQAHTGSVIDQLRMAEGRIEGLSATATQMLSNTQDANMARVTMEYSNQKAGYEAALRAGATIVQMSLLEFLK